MSDPASPRRGELQAGVDSAGVPVTMTDGAGRMAFWNREIADLFGYDMDEFGDLSVRDLVPERLRDVHDLHVSRYREDPGFRSIDSGIWLIGRRSDGSEFPLDVSLGPLEHDGQSYVMVIAREADRKQPI